MFGLLRQTEELWQTDSFGKRVLSAEDILKYKVCSAGNGAGTIFVPYKSIEFTGNSKDKGIEGFVAEDEKTGRPVNYSAVKLCSNPTW